MVLLIYGTMLEEKLSKLEGNYDPWGFFLQPQHNVQKCVSQLAVQIIYSKCYTMMTNHEDKLVTAALAICCQCTCMRSNCVNSNILPINMINSK
jgi:hypothetical protein